jgi:hypothetical protein
MKKLLRSFVLLLTVLPFLACTSKENVNRQAPPATEMREEFAPPLQSPSKPEEGSVPDASENGEPLKQAALPNVPEKKLVKRGSIRMEVADYAKARKALNSILDKHGSDVISENETSDSELIRNHIILAVPPKELDSLMEDVAALASNLDNRNVSTEDVTAQYVDMETRLKVKRESEQRYMAILSQAKRMDDIIKLQDQIDAIQEEIESKTGELKVLQNQIQYSTLSIELYHHMPARPFEVQDSKAGFFPRLGEAVSEGWHLIQNILIGLLYLWPLLVIGMAAYGLFRWRKLHKKMAGVPEDKEELNS